MKKVIIVLLAIMMFGCVSVSAVNDFPFSDYTGEIKAYWFCFPNETWTKIIMSDTPILVTYTSTGMHKFVPTSGTFYYFNRNSNGTYGTFMYDKISTGGFYDTSILNGYSNHNIFETGTGDVFFSLPVEIPPTQAEVLQSSLGNLTQGFGRNLGVLLPVGVILLSIILVMSLIPRLRRWFPL